MKTQIDRLEESAKIFVNVFVDELGKQGAIDRLRQLSIKYPLSIYTVAFRMLRVE